MKSSLQTLRRIFFAYLRFSISSQKLIFAIGLSPKSAVLSFAQVLSMTKSVFLWLALCLSLGCWCQSTVDEAGIRSNALEIGKLDSFDDRIAGVFSAEKLILVGEIHGTAEPAGFVNYLVANMVRKGRRIYVGMEANPQDLVAGSLLRDSAALSNSPFFKNESFGRASQAWLKLIVELSRLDGVHLFFFDLTKEQMKEGASHRDSLMYINIKKEMLRDTGALYICLSGNAHNILTGDRYPVPMGNYLLQDKALGLSLFNLVSFNQAYAEGGGYFNTGDGTRLHTLQNSDYLYTLTGFRNYFSFTHQLINGDYNGVLFTYHVTASFGLH